LKFNIWLLKYFVVAVTHPSINRTRRRLTTVIGREPATRRGMAAVYKKYSEQEFTRLSGMK